MSLSKKLFTTRFRVFLCFVRSLILVALMSPMGQASPQNWKKNYFKRSAECQISSRILFDTLTTKWKQCVCVSGGGGGGGGDEDIRRNTQSILLKVAQKVRCGSKKYSKSLSWAENLNMLFTLLDVKFKFSAQDLEYFLRHIKLSDPWNETPSLARNTLEEGLKSGGSYY